MAGGLENPLMERQAFQTELGPRGAIKPSGYSSKPTQLFSKRSKRPQPQTLGLTRPDTPTHRPKLSPK